MTLNLRKLLSISTQLTFEACRIIHDSWTNHTYQSFFKGPDDLVTDVHIPFISDRLQSTIHDGSWAQFTLPQSKNHRRIK